MSEASYARAAAQLWQAWTTGELLDGIDAEVRPRELDEGYGIQRALDELAGPSAGWKIAATSKAGQQHLGVPGPMLGRLYEMQARDSGASLSVRTMRMRSAEPEFAFRFARDIAPATDGITREQVLNAVGAVVLAIEVPDSRFADFGAAGGPQLVADAMCGGHFVLGRAISDWRALDLPRQRARMLRRAGVVRRLRIPRDGRPRRRAHVDGQRSARPGVVAARGRGRPDRRERAADRRRRRAGRGGGV